MWLFLLGWNFIGLAIAADDYLSPSLGIIAKKMGVPHNVAAASFLAFGSAVPEIMTSVVSTISGKVDVSLPAILGSGCIAYGVIPSVCVIGIQAAYMSSKDKARAKAHGMDVNEKGDVPLMLTMKPLIRDVGTYCVSLALTLWFISDGLMKIGESATLLTLYVLYIMSLYCFKDYWGDPEGDDDDESESQHLTPTAQGDEVLQGSYTKPTVDENGKPVKEKHSWAHQNGASHDDLEAVKAETNGDDDDDEGPKNWFWTIVDWLYWPLEMLFGYTIPNCEEGWGAEGKWYIITFIMALAWTAVLSITTLKVVTQISFTMGLKKSLSGVTLVALGAEVPDTFASLAVAKVGEGTSAVSNCLNSQIINLLIGLGLPYFIRAVVTGVAMSLGSPGGTQVFIGILLGLIVLAFILYTIGSAIINHYEHPRLTMHAAFIMLLIYAFVVSGITVWEYTP